MITLTTEQAQQIEWALNGISNHPQLGAVINTGPCKEALAAIRAARAQGQAEQEPVAWMIESTVSGIGFRSDEPPASVKATCKCTPLYAAPQPVKQE